MSLAGIARGLLIINNFMQIKYGAWYTSSVDGAKISTTVKGFLIGITAIILYLAQFLEIPLTSDQWLDISTNVTAAVSSAFIVFGLIQKIFAKVMSVVEAYRERKGK